MSRTPLNPLPPCPYRNRNEKMRKKKQTKDTVSQDRAAPSFPGWQLRFSFLHLRVGAVLSPNAGFLQIHKMTVGRVEVSEIVTIPVLLLQDLLAQLKKGLKDRCHHRHHHHHCQLICHFLLSNIVIVIFAMLTASSGLECSLWLLHHSSLRHSHFTCD